jgi:hypothetical protein
LALIRATTPALDAKIVIIRPVFIRAWVGSCNLAYPIGGLTSPGNRIERTPDGTTFSSSRTIRRGSLLLPWLAPILVILQ